MPKSYWGGKTCYQLYLLIFYHILFFYFLLHFTPHVSHSKNPSSAQESELLPGPSDFQVWVSTSLSPVFLFPPKLSFEILLFCFLAQTVSQTPNCMCFYWFAKRVFKLAFIFNQALASLWIPSSSSLSMGSMCKPLCSWHIHEKSLQNWQLVTAIICNQIFALLSFQESQVVGKNMSGPVEVEQVLLWDGLGSKIWSGSGLPCTFLP